VWSHPKFGIDVPIFLDTQKALFTAVIGDNHKLQDENLAALEKLLVADIEKTAKMEWIGIIQINFGGWRDRSTADDKKFSVTMNFERYWIAQKSDRRWLKSDWENKADKRLADCESFSISRKTPGDYRRTDILDLSFPFIEKADEDDDEEFGVAYVPYREDLWFSLVDVGTRIEALENKLNDLIMSDKGRAALVENASKFLLPAPKKKGKS
jgi:hypothetical protein